MDVLSDLLNTELFGHVRVKYVLQAVLVFLVLRWLWQKVRPKRAGPRTTGPARCSCGWRGQASLHAPRCPRCGKVAFLD